MNKERSNEGHAHVAQKKNEEKEEKRSQPAENKSAAELAYEWDDEGVEEEKPKTPKKVSEVRLLKTGIRPNLHKYHKLFCFRRLPRSLVRALQS